MIPPTQELSSPRTEAGRRLALNETAADFISKYGSLILRDAVRFSLNQADAEDAYQRSLEILITKAPSTDPEELVPWLRTVVRREAVAIATSKHNTQMVDHDDPLNSVVSNAMTPDEQIEMKTDFELGADAMRMLSGDQVRCLLAQSEGLTYDEIVEVTGFSHRKVVRCIHNGRRAFATKLEAIASGSECERMEPLIHRVLDSDADAAIELRPHLRHCLACRDRLRQYERAPRKVAVLFPPALVLVGEAPRHWWHPIANLVDQVTARLAGPSQAIDRLSAAEPAKKAAAGLATLALATGSGAAVHHRLSHRSASERTRAVAGGDDANRARSYDLIDEVAVVRPPIHHPHHKRKKQQARTVTPAPTPRISPAPQQQKSGSVDDGSAEFLPEER